MTCSCTPAASCNVYLGALKERARPLQKNHPAHTLSSASIAWPKSEQLQQCGCHLLADADPGNWQVPAKVASQIAEPPFLRCHSSSVTHHWHLFAYRGGQGQTPFVQPHPLLADLYDQHHDIKAAHEWMWMHADPGNWQVPAYVASDFASMFVYERAQIAKAANKPFILEETGKEVRLIKP